MNQTRDHRIARPPWLWVLLGAMAWTACSSSGTSQATAGSGKIEHVILAPGTGPTNTEPLWPMRVGTRYSFANGEWTVARKSDRYGPAWNLEQASGDPHPILTWFGRNQGRPEAFWSEEAAGLVLRAAGSQAALDVPRLVVPATVRRGMKWQSRGPDGTVWLSGEIDAGDNQDTIFGRRRVWTLRIDVPNRGKWEQDFIEGRGPVSTKFSLVPLTEKTDALPPRVTLQATGIAPLQQHAAVASFSVIEDPKTGRQEANMGIYVPGIMEEDVGIQGIFAIRYPYRRACFATEGGKLRGLDKRLGAISGQPAEPDVLPPHDYDDGPCQDAAGVVLLASGERKRLPLSVFGKGFTAWPNAPHCVGVQGMKCPNIPLYPTITTGAYADIEPDTYRAFVYNAVDSTGSTVYGIPPPVVEGVIRLSFAFDQNPASDTLTTNWGSWLQPLGFGPVTRMVALEPATPAGMRTVFHVPGWVGHADVRRRIAGGLGGSGGAEPWIGEHISLDLPDLNPSVTVLHADNRRDLYEASEDGLIWMWQLVDGVLQRTFLTALQLPAGEQLVGIVPTAPNRLQVWTQDGMAFAWEDGVDWVGMVYYWIDDVTQHVRDVDLPGAQAADPPVLWQGLQVTTTGRDVLMCAPRGRTLPDAPWTLGGEQVRSVRQDERCLLLVRPYAPKATPVQANEDRSFPLPNPDYWLLRGTLPDLGEVEIGLVPEDHTTVAGVQIPLKNGGFLGSQVRTGPGFGLIERAYTSPAYPLYADPQDESLWLMTKATTCANPTDCLHFFWDSMAILATPSAPPDSLQGTKPLPGVALRPLDLSYQIGRGFLWRTDLKTSAISGVQIPRGERFARIDGLWGTCAADGVCFLALAGAANDQAPQSWTILRADRQGSGLHEVLSGWSADIGAIAGILADKDTLILHDGTHVLWRGFRDAEPATCPGCSANESCLRGFCPCTFGQISFDGLCADDAGSAVYTTCKDALAAGVSPDKPVRIDGDGAGPSPTVLTRCNDAEGWTPMPTYFEPTTSQAAAFVGCSSDLPPPSNYLWYLSSSAAALHGEFELEFEFGQPTQSSPQDPVLVLAPLTDFTKEGKAPILCKQMTSVSSPDQIAVGEFGAFWSVVTATDNLKLGQENPGLQWLRRDGAGIVRYGRGTTTMWTSPVPFKHDSRLVKIESIPITIKSLRWKGTAPDLCFPNCQGLLCGDDGCGGSCGACGADRICGSGKCVCNPPLYDDGKSCVTPVGTEAYPAESCAAVMATSMPWSATPWIDPNGPGGEAPFQQALCNSFKSWTVPPQTFLGTSAVITWDPTTKTCQPWSQLPGPPASPLSSLGDGGKLDGMAVPSGRVAAATWQTFASKTFTLQVALELAPASQSVRMYLDGLENFAADTAIWTGWMTACGLAADTSMRFTLTRDAQGIWASVGSAAPQLVLAPDKAGWIVTINRTDGGSLVLTSGSNTPLFQYDGPLPAKLRAVGEVEGGGASSVILMALQWM